MGLYRASKFTRPVANRRRITSSGTSCPPWANAPEPVGPSTFSRRRSGGAPAEVRVVLRQRQLDRGGIRRNHHLRLLTLSESEEVARVERQQQVGPCAFGFDKVKRVVHGPRLQRT